MDFPALKAFGFESPENPLHSPTPWAAPALGQADKVLPVHPGGHEPEDESPQGHWRHTAEEEGGGGKAPTAPRASARRHSMPADKAVPHWAGGVPTAPERLPHWAGGVPTTTGPEIT